MESNRTLPDTLAHKSREPSPQQIQKRDNDHLKGIWRITGGNMLQNAQAYLWLQPVLAIWPGVFIALSFFFVRQEIALENKNFIEALQDGWVMTRGERVELFTAYIDGEAAGHHLCLRDDEQDALHYFFAGVDEAYFDFSLLEFKFDPDTISSTPEAAETEIEMRKEGAECSFIDAENDAEPGIRRGSHVLHAATRDPDLDCH